MKITKTKLKQIIKEELSRVLEAFDSSGREISGDLIDLLFYDVKDKDETETLDDIFKEIMARRADPMYTHDMHFGKYSKEQIWAAIVEADEMPARGEDY
jgi:hypothetical protein